MRRALHPHLRVYQQVRNAHLERAHASAPASLVYADRRYDFDDSLADGLDLHRARTLRTAALVAASPVRTLEVNEPAMRLGLVRAASAVAAARATAAVRRRPVRVVTYAIGNLDEWQIPADRVRARVRRRAERVLSRWVAGRLDRIAYGTDGARRLYDELYGDRIEQADAVVVPALPERCGCLDRPGPARDPERVLFVGALQERKGVLHLLAAWPQVVRERPGARLTVIGTGELESHVREVTDGLQGACLVVDPPRAVIHDALREATVVVLLSQRTPTWREQVGLPIVEGLAHGCTVVTTGETGLAEWLAAHGHSVIPAGVPSDVVAGAVLDALGAARPPATVLRDLPAEDGRRAADAWLADEAGVR
ncbi:glycosyltransferase [Luteipulveratus sp. YIM 133132]|uniref:glycosyltransferase n=1 Tax=Luteipulveratus flavus TaxID=3031728 RepID=UPI0023B054CF|nr:glycosyltransferase [Luteipulveratus sp. YIM 133132]MDE9364323.1 glycosyltransferase [Luteipulveratus sp. YIM 133132]